MANISRQTIVELVYDLIRDNSAQPLAAEKFIEYALLDLNRDRPLINITAHTFSDAERLTQGGMQIDLPSGYDIAQDKIVDIELLYLGTQDSQNTPNYLTQYDWFIYPVSTGSSALRFNSQRASTQSIKIYWRSNYSFDTEVGSNIPLSLSQPLTLITAYHYAKAIAVKYSQARSEGGDEIRFIANKEAMFQAAKSYKEDYDRLIQQMPTIQYGIVPQNTQQARVQNYRWIS